MFLVSPGPQVFPPPLSWFSLQQRSFRSGNRGGKHVARSICKTVPYEGEPQLTLKFPVPIFHQTNQTAPKKTLEFLRLSQKKETKRHFVNSQRKKKTEFLESASPKAPNAFPRQNSPLGGCQFFFGWERKAITN